MKLLLRTFFAAGLFIVVSTGDAGAQQSGGSLFDSVYSTLTNAAGANSITNAGALAGDIAIRCREAGTNETLLDGQLTGLLLQSGIPQFTSISNAAAAAYKIVQSISAATADEALQNQVAGSSNAALIALVSKNLATQVTNAVSNVVASAVAQPLADATNQLNNQSNQLAQIMQGMTNADAVSSPFFHAEAGTVVLQPFTLSSTGVGTFVTAPYKLTLGSADIRGMVQGVYENRYAWRHDSNPYWTNSATNCESYWLWGHGKFPVDFEVRMGYAFGGSTQGGGATAGSGDFFGEAAFGMPIWSGFYRSDTNSPYLTQTVGPEAFATFASDSTYSQVHPAYGMGVSYVASIPLNSVGLQTNRAQFATRLGYALVDGPDMVGASNGIPLVGANGDGLPRFGLKGAVDISGELRFPISLSGNQFGYLSVGGTSYSMLAKQQPDEWSLYIALSFNLSRLAKSIIPGN